MKKYIKTMSAMLLSAILLNPILAVGAQEPSEFQQAHDEMYEMLAPLPETGMDASLAAIVSDLSNPFWVTMQNGYEDAAEEFGVTIDVQAAQSSADTTGQLDLLNNLLIKEFDAIAVSPLTEDNLVPGIVTANEQGVHIVASGTQVSAEALEEAEAHLASQIIVDFYQQGVMGAEYIVEQTGGEGKVAVIAGVEGGSNGDGRRDGAVDTFEDNGMEVVSVVQADFDKQKAYEAAVNILQANPDIVGFACGNDDMAMGVVQALEEQELNNQVYVVGVDFTEVGKEGIKAGTLDATVAMSPYLMGKETTIIMLKAIQGDDVSELGDKTPMALVTMENVDNLEDWK